MWPRKWKMMWGKVTDMLVVHRQGLLFEMESSTMLESHRVLKNINSRKASEPEMEQWKARTEECSLPRWNRKRAWWCISKRLWTGSASAQFKGAGDPNILPFFVFRTEIKSTGCSHHAEKHRVNRAWQEKSLKKWEVSKLVPGKKWLCLKN